jgi:hypothetical protein
MLRGRHHLCFCLSKFKYCQGMSLEAGNWRKSPVILAVIAGYFFSLKKIMRENLVSAIQRTVRVG